MYYGPLAILLFALLSSPLLIGALRRRMRGWRLAAVLLLMAYIMFAAKYFFFPIYFVGDGLRGAGLGLELIPVRPLVEQARHMGAAVFLRNVGGNILAFLPLTFLCPMRGGVSPVPALRRKRGACSALLAGRRTDAARNQSFDARSKPRGGYQRRAAQHHRRHAWLRLLEACSGGVPQHQTHVEKTEVYR